MQLNDNTALKHESSLLELFGINVNKHYFFPCEKVLK